MEEIHNRLVGILRKSRHLAGSKRPLRVDKATHTQMLLAKVENASRTHQYVETPRHKRTLAWTGVYRSGGMVCSSLVDNTQSTVQQDSQKIWIRYTVGTGIGGNADLAQPNRRMRKTACPVVWKVYGLKCP